VDAEVKAALLAKYTGELDHRDEQLGAQGGPASGDTDRCRRHG